MRNVDLTEIRALAESTLGDHCVITRAGTGASTVDATTLVATAPADATIYSGPCAVTPVRGGRRADEGGGDVAVDDYELALPITAEVVPPGQSGSAIRKGDSVLVDEIEAGGDPGLLGGTFTIGEGGHARSHAVLRRFNMTAVARTVTR